MANYHLTLMRTVKSIQRKHNLPGTVTGRGVTWEVEVSNEKDMRAWKKLSGLNLGGFRNGWGGWNLSETYKACEHEFCSVYSRHHY